MPDQIKIFECQKCGWCCLGRGGVRLSLSEAESAASFLNISLNELKRLYLASGEPPWEVKADLEGFCMFYQPLGHSCLIHPVKPGICNLWPFLPGPLKDESAFKDARESCPGLAKNIGWQEFKTAWAESRRD